MNKSLYSEIYAQYNKAGSKKSAIGRNGITTQAGINRRFYSGDQWGANAPHNRPLVRYNVIKRIGEFKTSAILSAPLTVRFSARGDLSLDTQTSEAVNAMNEYFSAISERMGFDRVVMKALKDSYITGTGIVYAYWDSEVHTGRFLDDLRKLEIRGDVKCETVGIENVFFGDCDCTDVQKQPYIIIARRMGVSKAKALALSFGNSPDEIVADDSLDDKVTVLTRFRKTENSVVATITTPTAVIRDETSIGVRIYPIVAFRWEDNDCAYGESEVTHVIPNQIAINRMLTASVWSVMLSGMPIMAVNRDLLPNQSLSNEPGQVIDYTGPFEQIGNSVKYFTPPDYLNNYNETISSLISQTLNQTGANAVALGDVDPVNTSAIIALRDSALSPLQLYKCRFYEFCSDVAKLFAEFWVTMYSHRPLEGNGYIFEGDRLRGVLFDCMVDVSESVSTNQEQSLSILNMLLEKGQISVSEYLERIPKGLVPDCKKLIENRSKEENV